MSETTYPREAGEDDEYARAQPQDDPHHRGDGMSKAKDEGSCSACGGMGAHIAVYGTPTGPSERHEPCRECDGSGSGYEQWRNGYGPYVDSETFPRRDVMRCDKCRYWAEPDSYEWGPVRTSFGHCARTPHSESVEEWSDDSTRVIAGEYADRTAVAVDGSGYNAYLLTKPEHFCAMFAKVPQETPRD